MVLVMSPGHDLSMTSSGVRFYVEQLAALATGITAAVAAFASVVPGSDRRLLLLPLLPLTVWLGSLGQGCMGDWARLGREAFSLRSDWPCLMAIVFIGAVPAAAIATMLRRGAPLTPHLTAALGGLAAAGLGDVGLRIFHREDASVMILVWQLGTVFALSVLAGSAGPLLLNGRLDRRRRIEPDRSIT